MGARTVNHTEMKSGAREIQTLTAQLLQIFFRISSAYQFLRDEIVFLKLSSRNNVHTSINNLSPVTYNS